MWSCTLVLGYNYYISDLYHNYKVKETFALPEIINALRTKTFTQCVHVFSVLVFWNVSSQAYLVYAHSPYHIGAESEHIFWGGVGGGEG